ncbi:hypothetical protein HWV62_36609 [Athelia sp. TMB]|nr:hypothetical protein HWV62_36609 [Athelia sp. TMB]
MFQIVPVIPHLFIYQPSSSFQHAPIHPLPFVPVVMSNLATPSAVKSASTSTFLTALWVNAAVAAAEIILFTILRPRFRSVYEARTITPVASKRVAAMSASLFVWPLQVWRADYEDIVAVNGMDAYFYVRFLRMMMIIFAPIWAVSWAVLMPVNAVRTHVAGKSGLDMFIFGNVATDKQERFAAHVALAWIFTFWIFYNIRREMAHFITKRQRFLISPVQARSVQATTVLVTGIPTRYLREDALLSMYSHLPGGVKKIWLNRDLKELPAAYERRLVACNKLESAENALMKMAAKIRYEQLGEPGAPPEEPTLDAEGRALTTNSDPDKDPESNASLAEKLVPAGKRPFHRLPAGFMPFALPFIGQKVDTITWAREQIVETNAILSKGRTKLDRQDALEPSKVEDTSDKQSVAAVQGYPPLNSAFVTFNRMIAAYMARDTLNHHEPYRMAERFADVAPEDVIWGNLGMNTYEAKFWTLFSYAATAALIVLWAIPFAFIGVISNVGALCKKQAWLAWLCEIPPTVLGLIEGVLPTLLLAVLMILLPIVLRMLAKIEGIPKRTGLELSLMTRYFIFQVVHSFLIVSLSSGIIEALPHILEQPTQIPSLLATNLPGASTFFLTYILLQALTGTAGGFLQAATFIIHYIKLIVLGSTPRSIYALEYGARTVAWGTLFPSTTLIVVIGLGYSIIAPVINGLVCVCMGLFYMLYKYLFLWVLEQPASSDTGGLFFPKAINHLFVGLYVQQVLLAALFFLASGGEIWLTNASPRGCADDRAHRVHGDLPDDDRQLVRPAAAVAPALAPGPHRGPHRGRAARGAACRRGETRVDAEAMDDRTAPAKAEDSPTLPTKPPMRRARQDAVDVPEPDAHDYGFAHPAAARPQRTIWLARDALGLAGEEEKANRERGIIVSTSGAQMDLRGKVVIKEAPPDEESRA